MKTEKIPMVCVVGPTASGKTALAVQLAERFNGEVISADSMQIYREMQIGTARPTEAEMRGVTHHLIGFLPLSQPYSVARFVQDAARCAEDVFCRGRLPVLAGGTGLYISSLVNGIRFAEETQAPRLRSELQRRAEEQGGQALLAELARFDPETAARLHPNNLGRIIRAIEIYRQTGVTMSEQQRRSREKESPYRLCMLGVIFADRQKLYERIDRRVDKMMADGLEEEARRVLAMPGGATALQAIGYKELAPFLRGECSREQAVENLKRETRRYAKRQLTWFRRDERVFWLERDGLSEEELFSKAAMQVEKVLKL